MVVVMSPDATEADIAHVVEKVEGVGGDAFVSKGVVQATSHLPIIVDPSHAAGRKDLVVPLARAAIAVGADGVIVDVHPDPE